MGHVFVLFPTLSGPAGSVHQADKTNRPLLPPPQGPWAPGWLLPSSPAVKVPGQPNGGDSPSTGGAQHYRALSRKSVLL